MPLMQNSSNNVHLLGGPLMMNNVNMIKKQSSHVITSSSDHKKPNSEFLKQSLQYNVSNSNTENTGMVSPTDI